MQVKVLKKYNLINFSFKKYKFLKIENVKKNVSVPTRTKLMVKHN